MQSKYSEHAPPVGMEPAPKQLGWFDAPASAHV
jgi:hypothetical protein